jgi:phage/conjugal plasmid C-4 type zinc finger TraR family protein
MADECDMAQRIERFYLDMALEKAGIQKVGQESLSHCEVCDEPIPVARRRAVPGVRLCIDCQEEADAGNY